MSSLFIYSYILPYFLHFQATNTFIRTIKVFEMKMKFVVFFSSPLREYWTQASVDYTVIF